MTIHPATEKPPGLRRNIAALSLVQISNYIIPLITLPFLTRALGAEAYGKVAFAQVMMAYFVLLTDYGFSWSATRKLSRHRTDANYVNQIFLGTWLAQWLLVALAATLAVLVISLSDRLRPDALLYAAAFTAVIGNVLLPVWFLQGLERLQEVAALQLISRMLALIPLFLLVRQPSDAPTAAAIQGGGMMLGGVLALAWMHYQKLARWQWPGWRPVGQELREGFDLFGSRLSISFYTTLVPLVLGWVSGPVAVAHFALADKLRSAAQSLLGPISQALFPRMSHLFATDTAAALRLVKRSALAILLLAGSASIALWLLADRLVLLLAGPEFLPAGPVLRWLAFLPLIIGFSNLFGVQIMLPNGMNRTFNLILMTAGVICIAVLWPLVHWMQARGAAASMLLVELFVTGSMAHLLLRRGYIGNRSLTQLQSKESMPADILIVGAGFAGAVCARELADAGRSVLVIDKRPHIGGNAYDEQDAAGVLVHPYGPHIFHTNAKRILEWLSRFTDWRFYEHRVLASVNGKLLPIPINRTTLNGLYGIDLDEAGATAWFERVREPRESIRTSEDVVLNGVGHDLCEKFFRGYTRKQWGLDLTELSAGVAARIPTRTNDDDRYFIDTYQLMPAQGYTAMFRRMLDHPNIRVRLGMDYFAHRAETRAAHTIYTGPIDAFFDYCYGSLPYRSLRFEHVHLPDQSRFQRVGTVNYPNEHAYTRITEFKHLTGQQHPGTSIVREYPQTDGEPYYPIPRPENEALFKRYEALARERTDVSFVGRLAQYRYYNMDQVVGAALKLSGNLVK